MKINVHAGHNPDGKIGCGAVGLIKESTEARKVKNLVIKKLKALGNTVYDCTVDDGTSQANVLTKIAKKCNAHDVDLNVSIHFNSGASDRAGNDKTTGVEVLVYEAISQANKYASATVKAISELGFKNRGVKVRTNLYILRNTKNCILIECCFVDDKDDVKLYDAEKMANAIVKGITGKTVEDVKPSPTPSAYKVKVTADSLNVRAGAGTSYKVVMTIKKGQVYTITQEKNGWGKLKSGAGWISLKYTKKV